MSLLSSMTRDLGITKRVSINDVRLNNLNFYDYQKSVIDSLADSILENGQMENAIAYESTVDYEGQVDGCNYTLLGGHTRYLAICKLYENGMRDGRINISVVEKPNNVNDVLAINNGKQCTKEKKFRSSI